MFHQMLVVFMFTIIIRYEVDARHATRHAEKIWPMCESRSICGYLQMNENSVHVQPLCQCKDNPCPLRWDEMDGHTVVHGNDQYKFCERIGRLPTCIKDQKAYISYLEMSLVDGKILLNSGFLHCSCPDDDLLIRNDTFYNELDNRVAVMSTTYLCKTPPICSEESICAAITENQQDGTSFITRHCACPGGSFCPTSLNLAYEKFDLDRGSYYTMSCI